MGNNWIIYEITKKCNSNCPICFQKDMFFDDLSLEEFEISLSGIINKEIRLLGGEPTLHPNFLDMIKIIHKSGNDANFSTNGLILSSDKQLVKNLFDLQNTGKLSINLSMNGGLSIENTIKLHGRNELDEKIKCLENLKGFKNLSVSMVIERDVNEDNVSDLFTLQKRYGVRNLLFRSNFISDKPYTTNEFLYLLMKKKLISRKDLSRIVQSGYTDNRCNGKNCCVGFIKEGKTIFFHEVCGEYNCWRVGRYNRKSKNIKLFWEVDI